jgi:hypothetical protein
MRCEQVKISPLRNLPKRWASDGMKVVVAVAVAAGIVLRLEVMVYAGCPGS